MDKVKVIGGLISFVGSLFLFIALLMTIWLAMGLEMNWYLYLIILIVAWAGSFNAMNGKRYGGALALAAGLIIILFYVLFTLDQLVFKILGPYSLFVAIFGWIPYVTIEALLMIIGGIIVLASPSLELAGAKITRVDSDKIARVDSDKIAKPTNCYKCGEKIYPKWEKCDNCKAILLCPQCNTPITDNWKICPNCQVDLDYGRVLLHDIALSSISIALIPIVFIILGSIISVDVFSLYRFAISELFNASAFSSPPVITFLVWNLFYFISSILIGIFLVIKGRREFRTYGLFFCAGGVFIIISLFLIRIYLVFMIGILFFSAVHIMGTCEEIYKFTMIAKNRKLYIGEREKEADTKDAQTRIDEAKKKLLGMIKSEKRVALDYASQILNLDQIKIRELIYELVGEEKIKGSFQENIFIIERS